jgi:hypothetical protein
MMRKTGICIFFGIITLGSIGVAKPIAVDTAESRALQWVKHREHKNYKIKHKLLSSSLSTAQKTHKYKIVELDPSGWIIVSLDDSIKPVIGYGTSRLKKPLPPALKTWLGIVEKSIDYHNAHPKKLSANSTHQQYYAQDDYSYIVRPLLWLGSSEDKEDQGIRWDQGDYYNAYTPVDENGNHTWTGCVATAMGQIMRYWKYPDHGIGSHSYTPETHPEYGEQSANFAETTYDWANMPLTLTSDNDAVAQALYHAGVAVDMDYTPEGSGAWLGNAMRKYFGYALQSEISRYDFNDTAWNTILQNELNNSRPVLYSGFSDDGGHQFIIDGYDSDGDYHFNWGWGGADNGKFTLDGIEYSKEQEAMLVAPEDNSPKVEIEDANFAACIRETFKLPDDFVIKEMTIKYSTSLSCNDKNISEVKGIEYFGFLNALFLSSNKISGDLDLSDAGHLAYLDIGDNNISSIKLSPRAQYSLLFINNNSQLNILKIDNLKNIEILYAYGTQAVECWQKNALAAENNITNIYMDCADNTADNLDTDGDGISNVDDPDDDNDGINDLQDDDIDGDEVLNVDDAFPLDANESVDTDHDGIGNNADTDDDGDGVLDVDDAFPLDANESVDTDHDGIGNNADTDDDNDGISDTDELRYGLNPLNPNDANEDSDGDGVSNVDEIEAGSNPLDPNDTKKPKRFVPIMMNDLMVMVPLN